MFNLTNLITTCVLATGVATTTPVNNANNLPSIQAETITNEYEFELNESTSQTDTYQLIGTQDENANLNNVTTINLSKVNYSHDTTNYVNVRGTKYSARAGAIYGGGNVEYYQNNYTLNGSTTYSEHACSNIIILQIDSYNYNLYTEMEFAIGLRLDIQYPINNVNYSTNAKYYQRIVYHTTTSNWATYIDMQLSINTTPYAIKNDIENVNNGFYYTKNVSTITMNTNIKTDTFNFGLEPNKTNYYAIVYTPLVNGETYNNNTQSYEDDTTDNIIPLNTLGQSIGTATISGTNVIPDGNYEVIDIPGLMWEILTMPFAFVSQAFNLTLFPGTPYQLNISNLFLSLIAVAVFIWLISFFLKMKG